MHNATVSVSDFFKAKNYNQNRNSIYHNSAITVNTCAIALANEIPG